MEERPIPEIGNGEVLVKMKAAGICGSDLHFYDGVHPYCNYPRVHGHELSGIVEKAAAGVSNVNPGDPVVIEPLIHCATCYPCRIGKYNCCANLKVIGAHVDGGFAEYIKVPAHLVHKIPSGMPFDLAATCEPYSIGYHSTRRAQVTAIDKVLVLGAGAIGLTVIDFAKFTGADVYVAEISPFRRNMATRFGADVIIDPSKEDTVEKILELTEGEGVVSTSHDKILALRGQETDQELMNGKIDELMALSKNQDTEKIKRKLKEIVPEYRPA